MSTERLRGIEEHLLAALRALDFKHEEATRTEIQLALRLASAEIAAIKWAALEARCPAPA